MARQSDGVVCPIQLFSQLYTAKNAKIEKVGKDDYSARVTWEYEDNLGLQYIWDERAEMKLRVLMYNREGQLVDSIVRQLSVEEISAREAELTFARPCINYRVEIVTTPGTSPFDVGFRNFVIKEQNDLQELLNIFSNNFYYAQTHKFNVRLETDLELLGNEPCLLGSDDLPFVGLFDGNGHTITSDNMALFRYLKNSRVCNLNFVYNSIYDVPDSFAVLAHRAEKTEFINCRVDYELRNINSGVGLVFNAKNVTIRNSLSFARWLGYKNHLEWAGFIYNATGDNLIENSLYYMTNDIDDLFNMQTRPFYYKGECELRNC